jgi:hypothetical protein
MQENLDGEEYDIAVLADRNSNVAAKVAMRKIGITRRGKAFAGMTVDSKGFDELVEKVVSSISILSPQSEFVVRRVQMS